MGTFAKRTITKTRRRTRDVDQVKADLADSRHLEIFLETKASEDLPGLGEWYCVECAKWFETEQTLATHQRGKPHKRRLKALQEEAYSQKEAEAAVGLTTDNQGPYRRKAAEAATEDADMDA